MLVLICVGHIYQSVSPVGIWGLGDVTVTVILAFNDCYQIVNVSVILNNISVLVLI